MRPVTEPHHFDGPVGRIEARLTLHREASGTPLPEAPSAVIAHPHPLYGGTMDNLVVRAAEQVLIDRGVHTLCFNFRGVGSSEGSHDQGEGEQDDLAAADRALDLAIERSSSNPAGARLWIGYSFGAATALRRLMTVANAEHTGVEATLLLAPPLAFYDFSFVDELDVPLALICGDADDLTPAEQRRSASEGWDSLVHSEVLAGAGHDLGSALRASELRLAIDRCLDRLPIWE